MPDAVVSTSPTRLVVRHAGLSVAAELALAQAFALAESQSNVEFKSWRGRFDYHVLVCGINDPLAQRARRLNRSWLSVCIVIDEAADRLLSSATPVGHAAFKRFLASILAEPLLKNPAIEAQRLPGLFPLLAQSCAKLDVVKAIYRQHECGAQLAWEADRGWVASNVTRSQAVALIRESGWRECEPFSVSGLPHVYSLESLMWMSCLRWRQVLPAYPDEICVAIDEFPDLPSVTQQQYLFETLMRWRQPLTKSAVGSMVSLNGNVADAALFAAALTVGVQREFRVLADGSLAHFALPVQQGVARPNAASEVTEVPFAGAIRRLARFFGLRSAASV